MLLYNRQGKSVEFETFAATLLTPESGVNLEVAIKMHLAKSSLKERLQEPTVVDLAAGEINGVIESAAKATTLYSVSAKNEEIPFYKAIQESAYLDAIKHMELQANDAIEALTFLRESAKPASSIKAYQGAENALKAHAFNLGIIHTHAFYKCQSPPSIKGHHEKIAIGSLYGLLKDQVKHLNSQDEKQFAIYANKISTIFNSS